MGDQNLDPLFVAPLSGDYSLQEDSPCIGSGRYGEDRGALPYVQLAVDDNITTPAVFELMANYPNPFNAQTMIQYSISEPGMVTITVYDILGRELETIFNENQDAGYHSLTWDAGDIPSGIYFYSITSGLNSQTRSMTLIK